MGLLGIKVGADLRDRDMKFMREHFGKSAEYLYHAARGEDQREVRPNRIRKSVGRERTFSEDLTTEAPLREALESIIDSVWQRIESNEVVGRTVTLKVKYADFRQITRSRSCEGPVRDKGQFGGIATDLLTQILPVTIGVRLLGLTLSGLGASESMQEASPVGQQASVQRTFEF